MNESKAKNLPADNEEQDMLRPAVGMKRFFELSPSLYRGAVPSKDDLAALKQWGIKTIIDFQMRPNPKEKEIADGLGIHYIDIPWTAHLNKAMAFHYIHTVSVKFLEILSVRENLPVYVHCYHGRERTGTMIAVYRMAIENWSYKKARDEMLSFGVNKFLHFNLFIYLKRFRKLLDKNPSFSDRFLIHKEESDSASA